ncbi:uncharacterized protein [Venturia canescens]|uniref:uncharacterized protein n=1 Tax=Venturia canescens TaxID=32260 RepID=UPI001C9C0889|nr:uncharacterized protein LOC122409174 [Venturia canescens]
MRMVEFFIGKMRIFKRSELIILFIFVIILSSNAAPRQQASLTISRSPEDSTSANEEKPQIGDHYDQRQNGTENYRIHVDGLVLVVAPIEGLLLAGGLPGIGDSSIFGTPGPSVEKPKPEEAPIAIKPTSEASVEKPSSAKSSHGSGLRLINLLTPFLRRVHHQHQ